MSTTSLNSFVLDMSYTQQFQQLDMSYIQQFQQLDMSYIVMKELLKFPWAWKRRRPQVTAPFPTQKPFSLSAEI